MNRTSLLVIIFLTLGNAPQATASSWFAVSTALAYITATNIGGYRARREAERARQEEELEKAFENLGAAYEKAFKMKNTIPLPLHEAAGTEKSEPLYTGQ